MNVLAGPRAVIALLAAAIWLRPALAPADTLDEIQTRGELVFGGDAEGGGPYIYPRDDDPAQVQGFEVELANLLAAKLGVTARFSQGQWEKLPDLLDRGDIDIVLDGYEWTPTWSQRYATSIPYYVYELQMLVRKGDTRLKDIADLATPGPDGKKMRIAVLGGSAAETYVRETLCPAVDVVIYEGTTDAMRGVELEIDGVDATLQDLPIVTFYESRFPLLRRLGEPVAPGNYVILARPEDQRLIAALNQAILDCYLDGSFPRVLAHYRLWNETQRRRGLVTDERGNFQPDPPTDVASFPDPPQPSNSIELLTKRVPLLLQAAGFTVLLAALAMPLATILGLTIAVGRLYGPSFLRPPLGWYVEVVRGTPLVLQLYVIFFLLPEWGLSIPAFWAAIIGLAVNYSAYQAEIYRAGLQAIPRGQLEAALSLGMPKWLALRRIIIPQALRIVIAPVMNDFIAMFKDTAVCSVITVVELSKAYYIHARSTGAVVELGVVTALLYLVMSYPVSILVSRIERRLAEGERT